MMISGYADGAGLSGPDLQPYRKICFESERCGEIWEEIGFRICLGRTKRWWAVPFSGAARENPPDKDNGMEGLSGAEKLFNRKRKVDGIHFSNEFSMPYMLHGTVATSQRS